MDKLYNENSKSQRSTSIAIIKSINSVIKKNLDDREISVADFGVSTGCNADVYLSSGLFPKKDKLFFIGNDLQSDTNWDLFKQNMEKLDVKQFQIVNGSFYKTQVCADSKLDICFSTWSLHWISLENIKNENPDATYCNCDIAKWRPIALEQFQSFLNLRSRELRSGGLAILICLSSMDGKLCDIIHGCWGNAKQNLFKKGLIGKEGMCDLFLPVYYKSKEEIEEAVRINGTFELILSEVKLYNAATFTRKDIKAISGPTVSKALKNADIEEAFWGEIPDYTTWDFNLHVAVLRKK